MKKVFVSLISLILLFHGTITLAKDNTNADRCKKMGGTWVVEWKGKKPIGVCYDGKGKGKLFECKSRLDCKTLGGKTPFVKSVSPPAQINPHSGKYPSTTKGKPSSPYTITKTIPLSSVRTIIRGPFSYAKIKPNVMKAQMEVQCKGGKKFTISDGTSNGSCGVVLDKNKDIQSASCNGSEEGGNSGSAEVDCSLNGGQGGCSKTTGVGTCQEK